MLPQRLHLMIRDLRIVFFRSNRISNRIGLRFVFESNIRIIESAIYHQAVTQPNPSEFCICDEREWCTDYGTPELSTCLFQFSHKTRQTMLLYAYFTPKVDLNANLTTTNRFFTNDDWQRRWFKNFESDHQHESNLESDVRFEIESNNEASQVPTNDGTHSYKLWVSEQFLNGTSAQLGYTVPFTLVHAGKYGQKTNQKQTHYKN